MKALRMFSIPIKGLGIGKHKFEFEVDGGFFKHFEESEIKSCEYQVEVQLDKQVRMMEFNFIINGSYQAKCDRCLEMISIPSNAEDRLLVKIGEEEIGDNEELVYLDENDQKFNLAPFIYEFIHLSKPLQNVKDCEGENFKDCDEDVLNKLQAEKEVKNNPIWDQLKNIELG